MKKIFIAGAATSAFLVIALIATVHGFYAGWLVKDSPEYEQVSTEFTQLQQEIESLESNIVESKSELDQLSNKELVVVGEVPEEEIEQKKAQLAQLEAEVAEQQNQVRYAKHAVNQAYGLITILDRGQSAIDLYKENYPVLNNPDQVYAQKQQADAEYAVEQQKLTELQQQLSALQAEVNLLASQDAQLEQAEYDRQVEIELISDSIASSEAELTTTQAEFARVSDERAEATHWTQRVQNWLHQIF